MATTLSVSLPLHNPVMTLGPAAKRLETGVSAEHCLHDINPVSYKWKYHF